MKFTSTFLTLLILQSSFSQSTVRSKAYGTLEFKELDYGLAKVQAGTTDTLEGSPTRTHGWLKDFEIIEKTDSIHTMPNAKFGVVYMIAAKDTVDIDVAIEWIYPEEIINDKGEKFKRIKYTTKRPTNIPSASSYSLDEAYETIKGNWQMSIYIVNKKLYSKTFVLY